MRERKRGIFISILAAFACAGFVVLVSTLLWEYKWKNDENELSKATHDAAQIVTDRATLDTIKKMIEPKIIHINDKAVTCEFVGIDTENLYRFECRDKEGYTRNISFGRQHILTKVVDLHLTDKHWKGQ